jgi:riboflavin kinase/FMN adenylyltransferase
VRAALDSGAADVVCFEPLPRQFFGTPYWKRRLTTPGERRSILRRLGIDEIIVFPFDERTQSESPQEFLTELEAIGRVERLVVGYDFHFGSGRTGSIEMLRSWTRRLGADLEVVSPVMENGIPVKSEWIRKLLEKGTLVAASNLLGRNYSATGVVGRGHGVGRTLGFPTINVRVPRCKLVPPPGSYVASVGIHHRKLSAAVFVHPGSVGLIEAHIPFWEGDVYGEPARVEFESFLRKPAKGLPEHELKKLIEEDVERVLEVKGNGSQH